MSYSSSKKKKIGLLISLFFILSIGLVFWYATRKHQVVALEKGVIADPDQRDSKLKEDIKAHSSFLNLFFNDQYLNIQESNIERRELAVMPQVKAGFYVKSDPPQNVQVRDLHNGKAVILIWNEFITPPESIKIFRTTSSGVQGQEIARVSGSSKGYYDYNVVIGKSYYYSLISVEINGDESGVTGPYQIGPVKDLVPPEKPKYAHFEVIDNGISITWFDPPDVDLKFINIYRSRESGELGERITQVMSGVGEFVDESIETDNKFYYLLTSVDESDNESSIDIGVTDDELGDPNPMQPFL